jgi:ABC-2 type transport system permease protein
MTDTMPGLLAPARPSITEIPPPSQPASAVTTCAVVAGHTVRKYVRLPKLVVLSTIQAALFLAIFRYVLGGAIGSGELGSLGPEGVPYVDFLVPGYVVGGALFSGAAAAAGVAEDVEQGFSDRLRSLPVPRVGLLAGRSLAETLLATWGMAMATALGFLVGFRIHADVPAALAAFGLCIVFSSAFTWVFMTIGLFARSAQVAQGMSMLIFPLTAVSSAFVPVDTMPGWLQAVADNQPITAMTNAVRSLVLGGQAVTGLDRGSGYWALLSLAWCAVLFAVFVPLSVTRFRRS